MGEGQNFANTVVFATKIEDLRNGIIVIAEINHLYGGDITVSLRSGDKLFLAVCESP